jgi:hypothetical protein
MGDIQGTSGGHFGDKCPLFVLDADGTFEGRLVPWLSGSQQLAKAGTYLDLAELLACVMGGSCDSSFAVAWR